MKKQNNKIFATIGLIIILTISAILISLPTLSAQAPPSVATHAFIGAIPNPVGVNQETLLHFGILEDLTRVWQGWENITITVEKPDGTSEILGPFRTDSTGGTGTVLVPTMIGTYRLQTHFPEQIALHYQFGPAYPLNYKASDSEVLELVVQEDPLPTYPETPLPTEFWSRPIDGQHRNWNTISGDWLEGANSLVDTEGSWVNYNDFAPETAHILWTKPYAIGGLMGGPLGGHAYEAGDAYQAYGEGSVIINGIYIYNEAPNPTSWGIWKQAWNQITAIDIRTGEVLWSKPFPADERVVCAQSMLWDSFNNHGGFAYVFTQTGGPVFMGPPSPVIWNAYDPRTGRWVFTIENVPSGSMARGPKGEILIYQVDTQNGWMALWNTTNIPALYGADVHPSTPLADASFLLYTPWGNWWPWNKTVEATGPIEVSPQQPLGKAGYSWNVTIPTDLPGAVEGVSVGNKIFGASYSGGLFGSGPPPEISSWTLSLEKGHEGELIHSNSWPTPTEWTEGSVSLNHLVYSFEDEVFAVFAQEIRTWIGFSMETGDFLWEAEYSQPYLDHYQYQNHGTMAYGNVYSVSIAGIVYCFDAQTGELQWSYDVTDPYNEFNWGDNWAMFINFITDGKIYIGQEMHSPIDPKPRGGPYICLDAVTGDVVWRADGLFRQTEWGGHAIIGDSIMVTMDTYDNRLYAVGKGPSEISVSVQNDVITLGSSALLKGTVMDVSEGTKDSAIMSRFPKGVPAVADESMSDWMRYVYKQFAQPMATGVEVKLEVVMDPNGNWYDIGTAMTDSTGFYSIMWEPPVPGHYTILASFAGSEGYYPSYTMTAIGVDEAPSVAIPIEPEVPTEPEEPETPTEPEEPETPTEPEEPETPTEPEEPTEPEQPAETPLITTEIAIILAVAIASIIGIGAFWYLRKR